MTSVDVLLLPGSTPDSATAIALVRRALETLDVEGKVFLSSEVGSTHDEGVETFTRLADGMRRVAADWVITASIDEPDLFDRLISLWHERERADIVIASQWSLDRGTRPKHFAAEFDRALSRLIARLLTLDVLDIDSETRVYRSRVVADLLAYGCDFSDPIDTLVAGTVRGWKIREIERPFWPHSVNAGRLHPRRIRDILRRWSARNGIDDADYDMRAFNSRIPLQRSWQQRRQTLTLDLVEPFFGRRILNVGCGSARINIDLPGAYGVDIVQPKLRYLKRFGVNHLAAASVEDLPFSDGSFDCVICAEVIEHVPKQIDALGELTRLVAPKGRLVISTPDYGTLTWPTIEKLYGLLHPNGYAEEHVTRYSQASLVADLARYGLYCVGMHRLYGSIIIAAFERHDD